MDEENTNIDVDEEYIDMEVSSSYSPPQIREFEFHNSSSCCCCDSRDNTSPADELFYKGKLLPLHLPPRLQMVENLLLNNNDSTFDQDFYSTPLMTTPITNTTPYESCNISPAESCQVSRELNPDEYLAEYSTPLSANKQKIPWTKKLKLIKQSSIGSKLKSSRAYLRSFFGKSGCSNESCKVADELSASTKIPFGQIQNSRKETYSGLHRRSFSLAFKRNSVASSSSFGSNSSSSSCSNSSTNSNGSNEMQFLKRNYSGSSSEVESAIQGAIAYCKKSQQVFRPRKTLSQVGLYSLSDSCL